jgi:hypothetical protein
MPRLLAIAFGFYAVLTAMDAGAWDEFLTGFDGNDCSACGSYWPWSPTCRWSPSRVVRVGYYRERAGDKGSASCHYENAPLPWAESVSLEMGERWMYQLKQGSWEDFGIDFTVSYTKTSSASVTVTNSCSEKICCLKPLKGFWRYSYVQRVRDREISTRWNWTEPGIPIDGGPARVFFGFSTCNECNEQTKSFSLLCEHPSPELLPAEQASMTKLPYEPSPYTAATLCTGSRP